MSHVQPGSIGVESSKHWQSLAIQWGTRSRYNHVVVAETVHDDGTVTVIEARPGGAGRRTVKAEDEVWDDFELSPEQRQTIVRSAQECLGIPYDWRDIAGFIWRFNRVKRTGKPYPDHPDNRLICSELGSWVLRQARVDPVPGVACGEISPGDLADFMFRHEGSDPTTGRPI
jgi:hypothetical protein